MIVVMGVRNGDNFLSKKYSSSSSHQLYRIKNLKPNGDLELTNARYQGDIEEDV